ncbi:MAG: hypothetical protein HDS64_02545 [Bacteroidales bacterium]|nr:hypothetical protein [Bacteroidales bacterium]
MRAGRLRYLRLGLLRVGSFSSCGPAVYLYVGQASGGVAVKVDMCLLGRSVGGRRGGRRG